jgi:homoserine O-acetyltransferase/O-succinyltransferase
LSSSPSYSEPPFDGKGYPKVTLTDNVRMQQRLVTEVFGIQKIALVWGWSMGGQQAYHGVRCSPMWSSGSASCGVRPAPP